MGTYPEKSNINIVVIGDADSGMSSIIDYLMYNKLQKKTAEGDGTYLKFESTKYNITVTDTQGNRNFIGNLVKGKSQADCALIILSAETGAFEASIKGKIPVPLLFSLVVNQLIIGVNKMDNTEPPYSESRFNEIKKEMTAYIEKIGYNPTTLPFVPINDLHGDNVLRKSSKMPWFKGGSSKPSSVTILEATLPPTPQTDKPLRILISDVYNIKGVGTVTVGKVASGIFRPGVECSFALSGLTIKIKSIEIYGKKLSEAFPGPKVGFNIGNVSVKNIPIGDVAGNSQNKPPKAILSFVAQIIIINHPGEIHAGYSPTVDIHSASVICKFAELIEKTDIHSGSKLEDNPKVLKAGDAAIVRLLPQKPMCAENFREFPSFGRFTVRDMRRNVAMGIIISVEVSNNKHDKH